MLKLGVRRTVNLIMLVNKNAVAAGMEGLAVHPVLLKVLHPHPVSLFFKRKEGSGKEDVKTVRHSRQPPSDVRAPAVAGVGGSVVKLTRKVNKQRCLFFSGRSFIVLPGPSDRPKRPVGPS